MPDARSPSSPAVYETRQDTEAFAIVQTPLAGAGSVASNVLRVAGYDSIQILTRSDVAGTVEVYQAVTNPATGAVFIQTIAKAAVVDPSTGDFVAFLEAVVYGVYAQVVYVNGAGVQTVFEISAYGIPISAAGAGGGGTTNGLLGGTMQGYVTRVNATTLNLGREVGDGVIEVNSEEVTLGVAGFSLTPADTLLTAAGADSGAGMAASTVYHLYVSNSQASFAPLELRASATAPTSMNGLGYLAGAGNGANWRWIGSIGTTAATEFLDDFNLGRLVANWFNRKKKDIFLCPAYANVDANVSFGNSSVTYAPANAGTGDFIPFIADNIYASWQMSTQGGSANAARSGLSLDSTTQPDSVCFNPSATLNIGITELDKGPSQVSFGLHTLRMLASAGPLGGSGITFWVALERYGAAANPPATSVHGHIWC